MENRVIKTLDEAALRVEVDAAMAGFRQDAAAVIARNEKLAPYLRDADRRIWAHDLGLSRYVGR